MKKIESLTPAQELRLSEWRKEWLAIGRSTEPADRTTAERCVARMYEIIGKTKPMFFWFDGLATAVLGIEVLKQLTKNPAANLGANLWANLRANLGAYLRANLGDNLWDNLRDNLGDNFRDNLWANLGDNLGDNLRANLGANLRANLWDNLRANLGDNLWANLWDNLRANLWANLGDNLGANLRANLGDNLRANLWDNLRANLGDNLWDNLGDNLWDNLWDNFRDNLWANLGDNLRANLGANLRANLGANLWAFLYCQHFSYFPAYYSFPHDELRPMHKPDDLEKINLWKSACRSLLSFAAFGNVAIMCERPILQLVNERGQLHCESGPAILCRDTYEVYALNNVRMKKEYVMTPGPKLNPIEILKESNVDIRRELIRKIGVEMMLSHLPHRSLDKQGDYELLAIDFPGLAQDTRYLKMLNPSIGVWHLEGVERECNTVQSAINWRAGDLVPAGEDWNPSQLT